ncbi:hypothetical protein [Sphingomonas hankyongi]|uniref:Uncharacterized protein n=1 Tax=Sphingomonas hankyongi TaxID=2908209 RepID=A0ABT0S2N7_9SPHN|nr:hypothetical protein [Sphingomonas hankyongi]MCL6730139.1 hypothetical protein [Sphingomonas hankyongi]
MLLVGASGSGKSTLAASMHSNGWTLLGDDAVLIGTADGRVTAKAVYRSLRLFQDSVDKLIAEGCERSRVADYLEKWNVGGMSGDEPAGPLPVRAIFLIQSSPEADIAVERAGGSAASMSLLEQTFALDPTNPDDAKRRLGQVSMLGASVPLFQLTYPRDYWRLGEVEAAIKQVIG